jgi:two-component system nitrogen regulation response regulator GlnG
MSEPLPPILLVEDDESFRSVLARQLRAKGRAVELASSAEEAAAMLRTGLRPGLVVLDINLPGDTGWDLLRLPLLRDAGSPPVIIASAITVNPRRLAEFRVAGYLPKPFPIETLLDTVERLSHRDRAARANHPHE